MKSIFYSGLFAAMLFLAACQPSLSVPSESDDSRRLNSLMTLEIGHNELVLQDFILNVSLIDSVTASTEKVLLQLPADKYMLAVEVLPDAPNFIDIQIWQGGIAYSVPCRKSDRKPWLFTFDAQGVSYKHIRIAGQMNDWTPTATPDLVLNESGLYEVMLLLSPGTYLYQMCLDGNQNHDPNNPLKVDNGLGKFNSIFEVPGVKDSLPVLISHNLENRKVSLHLKNKADEVFVYWQNFRLPSRFLRVGKDQIDFDIPAEAFLLERSYLRIWASNKYGVSNDVLVPLHEGRLLEDVNQIKRSDLHSQIIYFLLVDRFKNGDFANDAPLNRPDVNPKADFHGGDLAGLLQTINNGYFERLGVNTLWISPLNQNPEGAYGWYEAAQTKFSGYHGYWPISSSRVDHRFGTNEELKQLVNTAHKKQMNILLDFVANHVHQLHPLIQQNPGFATSLFLPDGTMNVAKWDEHRLTTWFDTFLPTLDYSQPEIIELMTDSAIFWLREFNLDGFRHDACKHVDEAFWRTLTLKIKREFPGKHPYQIGETYGSPRLISSYLTSGMLDGQFDFNVYDIASTSFAGVGGDLTRVASVLEASLQTYGSHNLMGYISGSHDKARFMAYASGDIRFGEDAKKAGWTREIGITDSVAYDKFFLLHAFNLTIPGVPVLYYGDEIGLTGGDDPDSRRMMRFENLNNREQKLWNRVSTLAQLRRANPVLMYGSFVNMHNTADTWVYGRKYFRNEAVVLINNSAETKTIEVPLPEYFVQRRMRKTFGENVTIKNGVINAELPAYSVEVLVSQPFFNL